MIFRRFRFTSLRWWRVNVHHVVFLISLFMLTTLVFWWAVFIYRSVDDSYRMKYQSLMQRVQYFSFTLGHTKFASPKPGVFEKDKRLEIIPLKPGTPTPLHAIPLAPYRPQLAIRPTADYLAQIKEKRKSQRVMIIGESTLSMLLLLISCAMIYRMYWLEKRTTRELHQFWNHVSHEIKTPITGLKAFLETLQQQDLDKEEMAPLVELALKQVARQQKLAENMLMGQKLREKGKHVQLTLIDMEHFIREYAENHHIRLSGEAAEFSSLVDSAVKVKGDPEALQIIFDNIVDNAIKYGGASLKLKITLSLSGKQAVVTFSDNGPGFSPRLKENIFGAYKRLKNELPGGPRGTGMGLYISRKLAREMGGELEAHSDGEGKGAQFMLYLDLEA